MDNFTDINEALQFIARNQHKIDSYNRKLEYICNYQKQNPEKSKDKCKKYYEKLKADPEKYADFLNTKKMKYREKKNLTFNL
jgi:hypothetical protein